MRRMYSKKQLEDQIDSNAMEIAKQAIQADKDIISQIVYSEDATIFPRNIIPLAITYSNDVVYFFNYNFDVLVDEDNIPVDMQINYLENGSIAVSNPIADEFIVNIQYIGNSYEDTYYSIVGNFTFNSYDVYYPSTGTKLYRHFIGIADEHDSCEFAVISNSSTPVSSSSFDLFVGESGVLSISIDVASDVWLQLPYGITYDSPTKTLRAYLSADDDSMITFTDTPTVTDTVTEL